MEVDIADREQTLGPYYKSDVVDFVAVLLLIDTDEVVFGLKMLGKGFDGVKEECGGDKAEIFAILYAF